MRAVDEDESLLDESERGPTFGDADARPFDDEPAEPVHVTATCRFCGTEFESGAPVARLADDCGGCRLNDAQCEEYARDLAAKYGYPKTTKGGA